MLSSNFASRGQFDPNARGYHAAYRAGEVNHCPGCGRTHWLIGRLSAECAFCTTALPLADSFTRGQGSVHFSRSAPVFSTREAA